MGGANTAYSTVIRPENGVSDRNPHADGGPVPSVRPAYPAGGAWRHNCSCGIGVIAIGRYNAAENRTEYRLSLVGDPRNHVGTVYADGNHAHTEPDWTQILDAVHQHENTAEQGGPVAMTELDRATPRPAAAAMTVADKIEYARALAKSGLLPKDYRHQPQNVLYAVEYGDMLGLKPMAAIQGIHVIDGKPTASAALISGLVRAAGHKLRVTLDRKNMVAKCTIIRTDDPTFEFTAEWDLDRAARADLCQIRNGRPFQRSKNGQPGSWEKYPENMLKHRAVTECARDACEDVLFGLHYTPEELGADVDEDGIPVVVEPERIETRTPAAAPEPADQDADADAIDWTRAIAEASELTPADAKTALYALAATADEADAGTDVAGAIRAAIGQAWIADINAAEALDDADAKPRLAELWKEAGEREDGNAKLEGVLRAAISRVRDRVNEPESAAQG